MTFNGFLYAIGGEDLATIVKAPINASGTPGAWSLAGTLTANSSYTDSLVINGYLVVFGVGGSGRGDGTVVQRAPFLPGGDLGAWETLNAIPAQGDNRAVLAEPSQHRQRVCGVDRPRRFGQLDHEPAGVQAGAAHMIDEQVDVARRQQLLVGDVDAG